MSKGIVGRLRSILKPVLLLFLTFCVLLGSVRVASQINQHFFRRRAETLLAEIQSLELRKTPWQVAQAELQHWRADTRFYDPCNEDQCFVEITLDDFILGYLPKAGWLIRLEDYLRWRFRLSYTVGRFSHLAPFLVLGYLKMGGRLAQVDATVGMQDGVVWSKGFSVHIETNVGPFTSDEARREVDCIRALIASAATVSELPDRDRYAPQLILHPTYVIGGPDGGLGWFGGLTAGAVMFTPYASPADIHRLTQLDLSCLTRWHPCVTRSDIMPFAWKQYQAEMPQH